MLSKLIKGNSIPEINRLINVWNSLKEKGEQHLFVENILKRNEELEQAFEKVNLSINISDIITADYELGVEGRLEEKINSFKNDLELIVKNAKYITTSRNEFLLSRKKNKLEHVDIVNHLLHRDSSGRTLGCGCNLCKLRYYENNYFHRVEVIKNEVSKLNQITVIFKENNDPFVNDFFQFHHPVFIKTRTQLTGKLKFNSDVETGRETARTLLNLPDGMYGESAKSNKDIVIDRVNRVLTKLESDKKEFIEKYNKLRNARLKLSNDLFLPC